MTRPIVVIPCCTKRIDDYTFDAVNRGYSAAVAEAAGCQPLLVPLSAALADVHAILDVADGILLSGSPSNIEPHHYSSEAPVLPDKLDPARDSFTLPLVKTALTEKIPLFAICRGFQEMNVALGGTLFQEVHAVPGKKDHREKHGVHIDERWAPAHPIQLEGRLKEWIGKDQVMVNSLHGQGVQKIGSQLTPQAYAEDGVVEAVMGPADHPFLLGVQWHPEWKATTNPVSIELFRRFGVAARGGME